MPLPHALLAPGLRSLPMTAMSSRNPKYLPLPHPTSATNAPLGRLSMNSRTLGQMANLVRGSKWSSGNDGRVMGYAYAGCVPHPLQEAY